MNSAKRSVLLVLHEAEQGAIESGHKSPASKRLHALLQVLLSHLSPCECRSTAKKARMKKMERMAQSKIAALLLCSYHQWKCASKRRELLAREWPFDRVHSSRFAFLPAGSHECGTREVPSKENHGHSARYFQKAEDEGQCEVTEMVQKRWQGRGGSLSSPRGGGSIRACQASQAHSKAWHAPDVGSHPGQLLHLVLLFIFYQPLSTAAIRSGQNMHVPHELRC